MATDDIGQARPARSWRLRNPRGSSGAPLTADERRVHPDADIYALVAAVVATALEDLDIGYTGPGAGTSNERYWRGSAYVWFLAGRPTGFERFAARLGVPTRGRLPAHPLLDDAAALAARRADVAALGLPPNLFDGHIARLNTDGKPVVKAVRAM